MRILTESLNATKWDGDTPTGLKRGGSQNTHEGWESMEEFVESAEAGPFESGDRVVGIGLQDPDPRWLSYVVASSHHASMPGQRCYYVAAEVA